MQGGEIQVLPDAELDQSLGLTGRLSDRIQAFHELIGLDNKVMSEEGQLNAQGLGVIYDDRELPELNDALDEVAANQRAIALLQNIRSNNPKLWQTITELPNGIRQACAGDLPTVAENELSDLPRLNLGGRDLQRCLELLRERYRLNPVAQSIALTDEEPARIVCSDGLL